MKPLRLLACLPLLTLTACRWVAPEPREKVYAAHEAGLTLQYENPLTVSGDRFSDRMQVRVATSKVGSQGRAVRVVYTSRQGEISAVYLQKDGGVYLSQDGVTPGILIYPPGFPDRVTHWEVRGSHFKVLGRAGFDPKGLNLPDTSDTVGVWVESESPQGVRQRTFLLPDIGEVETLEWRDGTWICVNRLVSRGFTDAPAGSAH